MTLHEPGPIDAAFVEAVLSKSVGQFTARNHDVEDVLERFCVELRMLAGELVIALEARQND